MTEKKYRFDVMVRGRELEVVLGQNQINELAEPILRRTYRMGTSGEHPFGDKRCRGDIGGRRIEPTGVVMAEVAGPKGMRPVVVGLKGNPEGNCMACGQRFRFDWGTGRWELRQGVKDLVFDRDRGIR